MLRYIGFFITWIFLLIVWIVTVIELLDGYVFLGLIIFFSPIVYFIYRIVSTIKNIINKFFINLKNKKELMKSLINDCDSLIIPLPEKIKKTSRHISQSVKDTVWNRDGGKCVQCGSKEKLEFDHIIPHSKGGSNTYRNIQLLCENCNRRKSASIG